MNLRTVLSLCWVRWAFGLLGLTTMAQAQVPPAQLILTDADNGATATAVVGESIEVNLRGNITTGYSWVLASFTGSSVETNGAMVYTPDSGGGIGVGGTFSFPFLATALGDTSLAFSYNPPGSGPPAQAFTVTIQVLPPPSLTIQLVQTNVVISWPIANSTNFFLEGTRTLAPAQWSALNVLPLPEGTNFVVTLGVSGSSLFFRLHQL